MSKVQRIMREIIEENQSKTTIVLSRKDILINNLKVEYLWSSNPPKLVFVDGLEEGLLIKKSTKDAILIHSDKYSNWGREQNIQLLITTSTMIEDYVIVQ
jgi:hypothetical protein